MKDKELRARLGDIRIRHCQNCKHNTIQLIHNEERIEKYVSSTDTYKIYKKSRHYECLTCGIRWQIKIETTQTKEEIPYCDEEVFVKSYQLGGPSANQTSGV